MSQQKNTNTIATKMTNTIATNFTGAASVNCHGKIIKRSLYFACSFISDYITIDNYYYLLLWKAKTYNIKWIQWIYKSLNQKSYMLLFQWHNYIMLWK